MSISLRGVNIWCDVKKHLGFNLVRMRSIFSASCRCFPHTNINIHPKFPSYMFLPFKTVCDGMRIGQNLSVVWKTCKKEMEIYPLFKTFTSLLYQINLIVTDRTEKLLTSTWDLTCLCVELRTLFFCGVFK